jgi:signal transduction histidine kinase
MAHCIKNILTGIWGGRDLLETGLQIKDLHQIRIGWNVISQCLNNISDLVLNMLNFSKKREPIRKMENINKVVLDAITIIRGRSQQKKIEIETHFMANIPDMAIDALAIQRALLNLLINGVETIESIEDETQGRLIVTTHYDQPENHITIAISDNGPGIPESIRPHLFEMFSSSKGSKGTGLGLVVSKKIVNEHGGDLEVQSSPGQGATFTVILPREISLDATAE